MEKNLKKALMIAKNNPHIGGHMVKIIKGYIKEPQKMTKADIGIIRFIVDNTGNKQYIY